MLEVKEVFKNIRKLGSYLYFNQVDLCTFVCVCVRMRVYVHVCLCAWF